MAFFRLILQSRHLLKLQRDLSEEKVESVKFFKKEISIIKRRKFIHYWIDLKRYILGCKCLPCGKETHVCYKKCYKVQSGGSYENFLFKSIIGFLSGFFLTYILFLFCIFQLNVRIHTATVLCSILGSILTVGLAFSEKVRCVVLLIVPQFFSKKGRQALLAYAFILALTGPAKNTLNNMSILSESLACGEEQLKLIIHQIKEAILKPFRNFKEQLKKLMEKVKVIIKKIKEILLKIKRIIMSIIHIVKKCLEFLANIINFCNKRLGTPFERCSKIFENAVTDCNAKLGPLFSWLCNVTYLVKGICYIVKPLDFVCFIVDFVSNSIVGPVVRKIKYFVRQIKVLFYVRIKFHHKYEHHMNTSTTMKKIFKNIVVDIKHRTRKVAAIFGFLSEAATLFFLFIIIKVLHYRYKFLTVARYDNFYITQDFHNLDWQRARLGKETVLPLNKRESRKYVRINSKSLVDSEKKSLSKNVMVLTLATIKLGVHMITDYCLFWLLVKINYYGRFQSSLRAPKMPTVITRGSGLLADLLEAIVRTFEPVGITLEVDTMPCLPNPIPPDYDRYIQIATTLLLCWVLTVLEPYGLRFRQWIMCYYHPVRGKERAIWLYNNILRRRMSFLKFARRQLKRKFGKDGTIEKVTCKEFMVAKCRCLGVCLGDKTQTACLVCGTVFREGDREKLYKCATIDCPGVYCETCFNDLKKICTICLSPIDYGDLSDIDEEFDSSDDENNKKRKRKKSKGSLHSKRGDDDDDSPDSGLENSSPPKTDDEDSEIHTDSDYSYQYEKNVEYYELPMRPSFEDVEEQQISDYASMQDFRNSPRDTQSELSMITDYLRPHSKLVDVSSDSLVEEMYENYDNKTKSLLEPQYTVYNTPSRTTLMEVYDYPVTITSPSTHKYLSESSSDDIDFLLSQKRPPTLASEEDDDQSSGIRDFKKKLNIRHPVPKLNLSTTTDEKDNSSSSNEMKVIKKLDLSSTTSPSIQSMEILYKVENETETIPTPKDSIDFQNLLSSSSSVITPPKKVYTQTSPTGNYGKQREKIRQYYKSVSQPSSARSEAKRSSWKSRIGSLFGRSKRRQTSKILSSKENLELVEGSNLSPSSPSSAGQTSRRSVRLVDVSSSEEEF